MNVYTKEESILRMNQFGASGRAFLFLIDYEQQHIYIEEPGTIRPDELLYNVNGVTNAPVDRQVPELSEWHSSPISLAAYTASFDIVSRNIRAGNSYLVNLTCATPIKTNLTLRDIFYCSVAKYKLWMKDHFVVFSPEIFVRMTGSQIYSYPMKGTIDAALPDARSRILNDPKETAEHATIVDLIRNDLSQVAHRVTVPRYRYIDELRTHTVSLLQVSSEVRGELSADWRSLLGEILFSLLPAGSITGAPKKRTLHIIAEAETHERGFYTGVMGYFDGQNLDSAVMIRFLEQQGDQLIFKSGGGITSQSDLVSEYNEMKQKVYVPIY